VARTNAPADNPVGSKSTVIASLAALGSAVLASSCCLPLLPFLFAAGTAGSSAFFVRIRPLMVAASIGFVALGFYQAWRQKMQSEDELGEHRPPLDFNRGRGCVYLFPAGNG